MSVAAEPAPWANGAGYLRKQRSMTLRRRSIHGSPPAGIRRLHYRVGKRPGHLEIHQINFLIAHPVRELGDELAAPSEDRRHAGCAAAGQAPDIRCASRQRFQRTRGGQQPDDVPGGFPQGGGLPSRVSSRLPGQLTPSAGARDPVTAVGTRRAATGLPQHRWRAAGVPKTARRTVPAPTGAGAGRGCESRVGGDARGPRAPESTGSAVRQVLDDRHAPTGQRPERRRSLASSEERLRLRVTQPSRRCEKTLVLHVHEYDGSSGIREAGRTVER